MAVSDAASVCWRHPLTATESQVRNIPLEPARAGAQDGSPTDHTATDPGTETTTIKKNTAHETTATAAGHTLQLCICGWEKVTSARGLKIHQGRKRCLGGQRQEPRIDQYFLRSNQSSQSNEAQRQDTNHSSQSISISISILSLRRMTQAQICRWTNSTNHRDLQRRKRSKGTDQV